LAKERNPACVLDRSTVPRDRRVITAHTAIIKIRFYIVKSLRKVTEYISTVYTKLHCTKIHLRPPP
jgi:hypothetical protein